MGTIEQLEDMANKRDDDARAAELEAARKLLREASRPRQYKYDFALLPTEYDLQGNFCTLTEARLWHLLDGVSSHTHLGMKLDEAAEEVIRHGGTVLWATEEPHALRIRIQGVNPRDGIEEFKKLLTQFLIPPWISGTEPSSSS